MSSISKTAILTLAVSAAGLLSLSLAELLPWQVFLFLLVVHLILYRWFHVRFPITAPQVIFLTLLLFSFELFRVSLEGWDTILPALRDSIVYLALLRLILPKTNREIYQIAGIGLTECVLSTIFTQSPLFLIGLVLMACLVPMLLSHLDETDYSQSAGTYRPVFHWPKVWIGIFILSCILFFVIPRPFSTLIKQGMIKQYKTGFSEELNLARSDVVDEDRNIIMRLVWDSGTAPDVFYVAGSRLEKLTKEGFIKSPSFPKTFYPDGTSTDRITVYPTGLDTLNVFSPLPISNISPSDCIWMGQNLYWTHRAPQVYELWVSRSLNRNPHGGTSIPKDLEQIAVLGRRIAGEGPVTMRIGRLEHYLKTHCRYTLDGFDIPPGVSPIPWFVFKGRGGSCEHFASALAVMLRGCGIPSRIVTGFLVHEYNTTGKYFIVRADDAHAWVEYLDNSQWHTLEATPIGAKTVQRSSSLIDSLRFRWIRWVIQYSLDDQARVATAILFSPRDIEHEVSYALAGSLGLAILFLILRIIRKKIASGRSGSYQKVLKALKAKGFAIDPCSVHEEHLAQIALEFPALKDDFRLYLHDYLAWRFGERRIDIRRRTGEMIRRIRESNQSGNS